MTAATTVTERRVQAGGLTYRIEVAGPEGAPPVIFGHSLLCDAAMWAPVVEPLSARFRTYNVDARGHGGSEVPTRAWTLWDEAEAWREILDALEIERVAVAGLSMGAMTGMRLALRHPQRIACLALLDTSAGREPLHMRLTRRLMGAVVRRTGPIRPVITYAINRFFGRTTRRENTALVEAWRARIARGSTEGGYFATRAVSERDLILPQLGMIRAPTLVLVGEEDEGTPPWENEAIARAIPGARLERIPRAGHLPTLEQPEAVRRVLEPFLAEALGVAGGGAVRPEGPRSAEGATGPGGGPRISAEGRS